MRCLVVASTLGALMLVGCGKPRAPAREHAARPPAPEDAARPPTAEDAARPDAHAGAAPASYPDLAAALAAIIPADARVLGIGELHARVDRAPVRSALAAFTAALPALGSRISDLVVETWIVDPRCGAPAATTTARLEATVKRPRRTKSEIAELADAARALAIQPHAMTVSCADYQALAPGGEVDPVAMLTLTTRELGRIATSAVAHRDRAGEQRPWIVVYGGALHNDRFPAAGVAEWSYAGRVDEAARGRFVEIDLIVPELAAADAASRAQPWFPLAEAAGTRVQVWSRGERSFVVILPASR